jgi:hypothetical protein
VPEAEEGGVEAELQYVEVIEDTEGTEANLADEGGPSNLPFFSFSRSRRQVGPTYQLLLLSCAPPFPLFEPARY